MIINPGTIIQLKHTAAIAEPNGTLTAEQLDIIYHEKWFKLSLPDGLRVEEALARIDSSLDWTVTLCSGATMFIGYLQHDIAKTLFADEKVCFGGSGRASGIAKVNKDGYEITGLWHYATGAPHCSIFTANCIIEKDGLPLQNEDGSTLIQSFMFTKNEVTIQENWNTMGMVATAGHSFEVKNLQVAADRSFIIDSRHATLPHPVYHYPFLQFAEATIAVNTLGMAHHFLDECKGILDKKESSISFLNPHVNKLFRIALSELEELRQQFYTAVETSWNAFLVGKTNDFEILQDVSITCRQMVDKARALASDLYPFCGMIAADKSSTINSIWRDIFTASQHNLLISPVEE